MQRRLRLRRKEDFQHLRATGRVWRHAFLILSVAPNGLPHNRYGFVVSKRLGNAVTRNRIRRLLREAVRQAHTTLAQGYDMAFIARQPVADQSFAAVFDAIMTTLTLAKLRQEAMD